VRRRWSGLVLLVLAIAAMVVLPRAIGRPVAGSPRIGPIPGPPIQGACLPPFVTQAELDDLSTPATVPCDRPHGAEITLVIQLDTVAYPEPAWPTSGTDPILSQPIDTCQAQNALYVGVTGVSPDQRVLPRYRSKVTVPDQIQWLAGQRWYACSVLPDVPLPVSYTGTAHLAFYGVPPAPFATCADGPHQAAVPCNHPHAAEQLTAGYQGPTQSWPPLPPNTADSCRQLAKTIIGTEDPEFGGRIEIIGWFDGSGLSCWLQAAGGRRLVGTLIGHGTGPLPLG
jgi:hypothetical protein